MKIKRRIKYYLIRLFRLKSSPHHVALGITVGIIPNWLPTLGFGPLLSISLAKLIKANKISAFIGGIMGTPIWPILFFLNYKVGSLIFDRDSKVDELSEVAYLNTHSGGFLFVIGAATNIVITSILVYFITYLLFKKYRLRILNKIKYIKIGR